MAKKTVSRIEKIRHSLAHILAMAVLEKYPKTKLGIGPTIEHGFYYDFDFSAEHHEGQIKNHGVISEADFPELEKIMRRLINQRLDFTGKKITPAQAKKMFGDQPFKLDLIKQYVKEGKQLTAYSTCPPANAQRYTLNAQRCFIDLCKGGHVKNTKEINPESVKLTKVAGAYWRGDEKNPMLTRIYAVAFETKKELDEHVRILEEAQKRDHRKLGKELGLFSIIEEIGPGLPLFYPKGALLRRAVENLITEIQEKNGYSPIWIPHITKGELYKISGHLDKFDAMYPPMELTGEASYYLKPMNCPHFMMLYKSTPHSYRELPVRWVSTTTNYRYEKSGELSGLTRVRALTQDDCHVFARLDQIEQEVGLMLDMVEGVYSIFGFKDFRVSISTSDPKNTSKYIGSPAVWKKSESVLKTLVEQRKWNYNIVPGEAAFYGPKIDFVFRDVIGREWQLSTVQLDMNLPERFELEYIDENGKEQRPVVIHRAILGSTERFLGILIEHYGGAFPLWLSPVQTVVIPISEKVSSYSRNVIDALRDNDIRVEIREANETLGKRIREAELQKVPYLLIVGEKEASAHTVSVRQRGKGDLGAMPLEEFIKKAANEIRERK